MDPEENIENVPLEYNENTPPAEHLKYWPK